MVRRFSSTFRTWVFVAALVQAVLPGVVSVADASAFRDSGSASVQSHIESHGTPHCPRVHQEEKCALCQFVAGATARPAAEPPLEFAQTGTFARFPHATDRYDWLADGAPSLPRAPPVIA
ncbi:MAG TPA: hypothetical protein VGO75_07820 [Gemmatimonadaceae bacterium]|nr:hypothetical protein [Gemmatimonadaceae bacterium]